MFPIREKRFDYVEVSFLGDLITKSSTKTVEGAARGTQPERRIINGLKGFVTGLFKQNPKKKRNKAVGKYAKKIKRAKNS